MSEKFDVWDLGNETIRKEYEKNNYECVDTGIKSNWCYVLFSSNGLYYPDTKEVFEEQIVKKNRYEWKWVVKNSEIPTKAGKIIYVRDIHKIWYSYGINSRENTIDKTLDLLKTLTKGYRVVTIGSSAGGYMAVLAAIKLEACYCLNFSGQYKISDAFSNPYKDISGMLDYYTGEIFYFVPAYCKNDIEQYQLVENKKCVKRFLFNDDRHASTMLTGNMPYIVGNSADKLQRLYMVYSGKKIGKIGFLFHTVPITQWMRLLYGEVKGYLIRLSGKHWNGI